MVLLPILLYLAISINAFAVTEGNNSLRYVPGRYLIEFDQETVGTFSSTLQNEGLHATQHVKIESDVFTGASYQFDTKRLGDDPLSVLSGLPSVKNVWPVHIMDRPKEDVIWKGSSEGPPDNIHARISTKNQGYMPHVLTQVDKLRAEGVTGKGVKIGIVDDGVDCKHPALGGCYGEGCVVTHGRSLVDNSSDPCASCNSHGTHVTGIIAAQQNKLNFTGAAPGANIGMYRVFACGSDSTSTDLVIAAITQAYTDGNQIISASLGGSSGWSENPSAVVAQRIAEKGVILTIANGNDGYRGPFTSGQPATGVGVVAIGSSSTTEIPRVFLNASYSVDNTTSKPFGWTLGSPGNWGNISLPIYVAPYNGGCDNTGNATDLSSYIVLLPSIWVCADWYRSSFAGAKGAKYVLFYPNQTEVTEVSQTPEGITDFYKIPNIGMVPYSLGQEWIRLLQSGKEVRVQITDPKVANEYNDPIENSVGGYMSEFSSWGSTNELEMKPDITAPGEYILSTYPQILGGYAVISGTSMSTPLVAGITALLLEARGKLKPDELRSILASTAKPFTVLGRNGTTASPDLAPVFQQGPGLAQVLDAAHLRTIPSVSRIALNDSDHFVQAHSFTIRNTGDTDATYALGHTPALTAYSTNQGPGIATSGDIELVKQYATVKFGEPNVAVKAGGEATISITFTQPTGLNATRVPLYSGFVLIDGSNGDKLSIPYLGVAGSMRSKDIFSNMNVGVYGNTYPPPIAPPGYEFILPLNENQTSPPPNVTYTYPTFMGAQNWGTAYLTVDAFSANGTNLGPIRYFPYDYVPRITDFVQTWWGFLNDWSRVPEGNYSLGMKALRIFGDRNKESDWQTWKSSSFNIKYA